LKPDPTALIIDPDKASRRLLHIVLEPQGYRVFDADTCASGLRAAVECNPDVITLDLTLPDGDGLGLLRTLREWNLTPVLVLSERTDDAAKVAALDVGASDYLTKPFSSTELLARLRVLQRPVPNEPDGPLFVEGDLVANIATHELSVNGRRVDLSRKEEALFYVLARYAGKVVTCSHLIRAVWGEHSQNKMPDLRVLVGHLRKKLRPNGEELLIRTEGSLGYSLLVWPDRSEISRSQAKTLPPLPSV
jgi:two-component system KDP operon response regulator KdpE